MVPDNMERHLESTIGHDLHTFAFTNMAWILSTCSGIISTFSSIFVIAFIARCRDLHNPYHKIMLFLSIWDVVSSVAIAFNTIPMPADVKEIYPFPGLTLGNSLTCTLQGFFILVGSMYTIWTCCTLNIYYVCTIRYSMSDDTINRRLLPVMFGVSTVYVIIVSATCLWVEFVNPRPYEPFCMIGPYPHDCFWEDEVECIKGGAAEATAGRLTKAFLTTLAVGVICILTSMIVVVVTVFKTELMWRRERQASLLPIARTEEFKNTRTALHQALMYIAAFLLTWSWLGIAVISTLGSAEEVSFVNEFMKLLFLPLQGFLNAAIFFANKIFVLRKSDRALTRWQALKKLIISPSVVPQMLLSQIEAVGERDDSSISGDEWDDDDGENERPYPNIRRTGRLRSDMPLEVESLPSNGTPSFDLSRAVQSSAQQNANNDGSDAKENEANSSASTQKGRPSRRRFYQWPPPQSSSSNDASSFDKIWNFKRDSTSNVKSTNSEKESTAKSQDASVLQDQSSTRMSAGCSAVQSSVRSPNSSVLADLSFADDTMGSRRMNSDYLSQGLSFDSGSHM